MLDPFVLKVKKKNVCEYIKHFGGGDHLTSKGPVAYIAKAIPRSEGWKVSAIVPAPILITYEKKEEC